MACPGWKVGLSVLAVMALAGTAVVSAGEPALQGFPLDAIGRLVVDDGRFCTAFVIRSMERRVPASFGRLEIIYENWLATAGHCEGREITFQLGSQRHEVKRIVGFSAASPHGYDVLIAAFMTYLPVPTLELGFGEYPQVGDKLLLIGYGRSALMMRVGPLLRYDERGQMEIHGYASPGNSGGPVLIPGTRRVVGIGVEATLDKPQELSSLFCLFGGCAVKPPYVAVHIDRLKGLASFR